MGFHKMARLRSYSVCVRILMIKILFIFMARAASPPSNMTLEISSQIPDDFDSPLLVNLLCKIPQNDQDNIKTPLGICLGTKKGKVYTKLASVSVFNPECLTYDESVHSQATGQISGESGFLSATLWVKRGEPEVDEYTCKTNFIDTDSRPNTMTISKRSGKIRFYTIVANELSDVKSQLMEEQSRVDAKIEAAQANFSNNLQRAISSAALGDNQLTDEVSKVHAKIEAAQANFSAHLQRAISSAVQGDNQLRGEVSKVDAKIDEVKGILQRPTSCSALRHGGHVTSARQKVTWPDGTQVLCDTKTDGGGWTIFQRRVDGQIGFYRGWAEYENGFGDLNSDLWLGLRQLNHLMYEGPQELRVDLKYKDRSYYARYSSFHVDDFRSNYRLRVKGYSGNATDALKVHDGSQFSTYDRDNDAHKTWNCAERCTGAWWYSGCHHSNLNGTWGSKVGGKGINWYGIDKHLDSASFTEMKTRPIF